ncbi:BREX-1 system adenine-specific DNA-methyltransferase PglX [Pseudomonas songnenensis]|uniref:BREX-1 system adenine-specific DNA-methyltransferase PglX n=1 Tax=Pseudomonas songnenensis TaxID=1176259 RepID=A0A482UGI2_9PSED|nr:BREX-1 system adenine-specific DNA-methyltransferase PglX [Pseudomonas songnenensis]RYJ60918.1 BREX-1 system adenine-specific DNA-methyltransferase PglX [Pseudomonas songnenensis]
MSENQRCSREQGMGRNFFRASAEGFKKIPGSPISYWAPDSVIRAFEHGNFLNDLVHARIALATGDNGEFIRCWSEVSFEGIGFGIKSNSDSVRSGCKWFPCNKGGDFRKWFGNNEFIINWLNDGEAVKSISDPETGRIRSHNYNGDFGFQESLSWSALSSSKLGIRYSAQGSMFVTPGSSAFRKSEKTNLYVVLSLLSSKVADYFLRLISATMNIEVGNILRIPVLECGKETDQAAKSAIALAKFDWDSYEISWDFTSLPLLYPDHRQPTLKASYQKLRAHWREVTLDMQRLEEENNRIFIDAYGLQEELSPDVPLNEITLTCNPHYRYGGDKSEEELEALLLADTMRELVSYAVGCMFGRYSLDKPGLILANQGETLADYLRQVPQPRFPADDDNVIPLLDGDWFPDDITLRFRQFLRVAFGDEHYEDNLAFIEKALGKDVRKYFLKDFYADHVKRYKKRPIYWLFSSPKGTFSALVYLHRYRPDTVSVVLKYLRDFRDKLAARLGHLQQVAINPSASQGDKTKANKQVDVIKKQLLELDDYERDILHPLATEQVELDLDKGVKHNYLELGSALKKIVGLDAKGED